MTDSDDKSRTRTESMPETRPPGRLLDRFSQALNGGAASRCPYRSATPQRVLAVLVLVGMIWLSLMLMPQNPEAISLDPSWQMALSHAAKHDLQSGVDYVFTFGPLGRFMNSIASGPGRFFNMQYDPELYYRQVFAEAVISLFLTVVFMRLLFRLRGTLEKAAFVLVVVLALPISKDALYLFSAAAVTVLLVDGERPRWISLGPGLLFLAFVTLMKFTFFVMAFACVSALVAALLVRRFWRDAAVAAAAYVGVVLLLWVLCGQSLSNIFTYISNSMEIAGAYSEAMALDGSPKQLLLSLGILLVSAALAVLYCIERPFAPRRLVASLVVAAALYLAWKSGFVRHDLHAFMFFAFAAGAPFLFRAPTNTRPVLRHVFTALVFAQLTAGVLGVFAAGKLMDYRAGNFAAKWNERAAENVRAILSPRKTRAARNRELAELTRKSALPRIRRAIGGAAVDILSYNQGLLFLNGLDWRPRPVFQSYSAYTPRLIAMNAAFFEGARAPEFVIVRLQPIDKRFPATEDAGALAVILKDYAPVLSEKGYALLRRSGDAPGERGEGTVLLERQVGFDEPVDIAGLLDACQSLSLGLEWSPAGKLRKFLYKAPPVTLKVVTGAGEKLEFRIVPGMVESGFILNPFFETQEDLIAWCEGTQPRRIGSFSMSVAPEHLMYFRPSITVKVLSCELKQPVGPPD